MTDRDRWVRLLYFASVAASVPEPPLAIGTKLAARERRVLEDSLKQTKALLAAFERRGEQRGAQMVRRSVRRLERDVLNARARASGLAVPSVSEQQPRGPRERATFP